MASKRQRDGAAGCSSHLGWGEERAAFVAWQDGIVHDDPAAALRKRGLLAGGHQRPGADDGDGDDSALHLRRHLERADLKLLQLAIFSPCSLGEEEHAHSLLHLLLTPVQHVFAARFVPSRQRHATDQKHHPPRNGNQKNGFL